MVDSFCSMKAMETVQLPQLYFQGQLFGSVSLFVKQADLFTRFWQVP